MAILKRDKILSGIALLVIGILFIAAPTSSARAVWSLIGIIMIVAGVLRGFMAFKMKEAGLSRTLILIAAAALIIIGIFITVNPGYLIAYSYIIFGLVMIVNNFINILSVVKNEIQVEGNKTLYLVLSAALLILGIVILVNPFATSDVMTRIIGVALIVDGIVNLLIAFRIH